MNSFIKQIQRKFDKNYDIKAFKASGGKIGKNCWIGGSVLDTGFSFLIEIGDNVTITHSTILAHDASTKNVIGKSRVGKVVIGDNVFIGWGSIVLPNVHIGNNVIIGAGSVVTKDIPDNSVAVGNPCHVVSSYQDFKNKHVEYMKNHPVYDTYHTLKSSEEIQREQEELRETWGYDE